VESGLLYSSHSDSSAKVVGKLPGRSQHEVLRENHCKPGQKTLPLLENQPTRRVVGGEHGTIRNARFCPSGAEICTRRAREIASLLLHYQPIIPNKIG
jgi:hypothetical protein